MWQAQLTRGKKVSENLFPISVLVGSRLLFCDGRAKRIFMPVIATKTPLVRRLPTRQGNRSRRPRGQWPRQRLRSASARWQRRRKPRAPLPRQQQVCGPLAAKADPGCRPEDVTAKTASRKRLKTRRHAGGAQ
jgi:hypothetical protein